MNSRLSRILGAPYDQLTEQHLQALKLAGVSEDQDLDFKQARYTYGEEGKFELAKDVAALANQVGGIIVVGIAEDDLARAAELKPVKVDDDEQRRMQSTIADRVHPMVHDCRVRRVDAADRDGMGYFLIDVPHSELAPHAVRWTGKQHDEKIPYYCYPLRQGTQTVYLTEPQIAARYRNRFTLVREQVDRLGALFDTAHRLSGWPTIAIGIVPSVPGFRPLTGDGDSIRHYADHLWKAPASNEGLVMSWGAYTIGEIACGQSGTRSSSSSTQMGVP